MYSKFFNKKVKTFIIAEIGVNHNGSVNICKKLIKLAKWCCHVLNLSATCFASCKAILKFAELLEGNLL